ncbi:hypothetical protein [Bacteroides sp. 519]|uniref:hypothetical protein n=1 Tax=Bacteroides sp. 519 TaxID=2302937 RepID=UPI0013CFA3CA|nr:hypothetical protein [Bacteroides sp. 519]NDV59384.1 hypothetical protein [Bacteroides sp. 519]
MRIDDLINKYFEGETSCEEERELRTFFAKGDVPEHLQVYRPLFAYINEEVKLHKKKNSKKSFVNKHILYTISGVAACLLVILGGNTIHKHFIMQPENYVMIDGKRYTDTDMIREHAKIAFNDVSFTKEDIFDSLFE